MANTHLVVCVNERSGLNQKSCGASGSRALIHSIQQRIKASGLDIEITEQVCLGRCDKGITMRIAPGGPFFTQVTEQDLDSIIHAVQNFKAK
jgi:(2Fe-2S) ferredoxin